MTGVPFFKRFENKICKDRECLQMLFFMPLTEGEEKLLKGTRRSGLYPLKKEIQPLDALRGRMKRVEIFRV